MDLVDIGTSDHLLLWVELGKVRKAKDHKGKRVIYHWRVESLKNKELREKYQEALESEVDIFVEKLSNYRKSSTSNVESVRKALSEWEEEVSRVARDMIGKKCIVCGRSVRRWDEELREMVIDTRRRACHKLVMEGNKEAWSEYCMKRKLLKEKREKRRIQSHRQSIYES